MRQGEEGLLPVDGQNGFPGQAGAMGPRGISGVPGCNGSKVKKKTLAYQIDRAFLDAYFIAHTSRPLVLRFPLLLCVAMR